MNEGCGDLTIVSTESFSVHTYHGGASDHGTGACVEDVSRPTTPA